MARMDFTRGALRLVLVAALLATRVAPGPAYAQADPAAPGSAGAALDEDALFDLEAFDEGVAASLGSPESARTEYLVGGTARLNAASYFEPGKAGYLVSSYASAKLFAKVSVPERGSLYAAYLVSQALFEGASAGSAYSALPPRDPYAPSFALSELHYSFDLGKRLFVRLGNQLLAWGPSRIWSPVDFVNLEKEDAFAALDARVGKPGLRLHLPLPSSNLFAFFDFSGLAAGGALGDPWEEGRLGLRLDIAPGNAELALTAYGGRNSQVRLGADASGRVLGATVYGEAALAPAYGDYEYQLQASAGLSRNLGDLKRWTISVEAFYDSLGGDYTGTLPPPDRRTPLYEGGLYAYASLQRRELLGDALDATLSALANLTDGSYRARLSGSFDLKGVPPLTLTASYAGGGELKEFTRYAGDNSLALELSTTLEF
jgi:hypothetical protein